LLLGSAVYAVLGAAGVTLIGLLFGDPVDWSGALLTAALLFVLFATLPWWQPRLERFFGPRGGGRRQRKANSDSSDQGPPR
jgi:hypothetical protein